MECPAGFIAAAGAGREDRYRRLRLDPMLPTLAERLREQHAKSRGRRPSRPPWPVPGEPPTALLFLASSDLESAAVPVGPAVPAVAAMADPDPLPPLSAVVVAEVATQEVLEPEFKEPETLEPQMTLPDLAAVLPQEPSLPVAPAVSVAPPVPVPPRQVPERPLLAELLLLLVWAVLVVVDGALALASLINGAAGRRRRAQASAASDPSPSAPPPFLMAAAAP